MTDPVFDLGIAFTVHQVELDVGVQLLEAGEQPRDPLVGHTGEGAHLYQTGVQAVQFTYGVFQLGAVGNDGLQMGQKHLTGGAQLQSGTAAVQQRHAPFLLQIGDHAADSRLGIAHVCGGFADASQLHGIEQRGVFLQSHDKSSLSFQKIMNNIKNIRLRNR